MTMFKKIKLAVSVTSCIASLALAGSANAATYYLKHVSTGKYATINSGNDRIELNASSASSAQAFEKIPTSGAYLFKASGGNHNAKYAVEPDGSNRQEMVATSTSAAESFIEIDCGDGGVYFSSQTTGANLKVESDSALGNGSSGNCSSSANKFTWEETSSNPGGSTPSIDLDSDASPSENFNLSTWNLSIPVEDDDGDATTIKVAELNKDYEDNEYFFTANDGAMVFKCPIKGAKTSSNTSFTRTELREMLRGTDTNINTQGVNENNWVFDNTSIDTQLDAGGVNGNMKATLKVDHVTTTGNSSQQGRVIIGQIHAPSNEPIRLYYRKLADHDKGSIYFAHEPAEGFGDEIYVNMIGDKSSGASNPQDGIALGEVFSYEINVEDSLLTVTIRRDGKADVVEEVNMSKSGYGQDSMYQYFKAGVYNQNNTGDDDDYVQASFYSLEKSHD